MNPEEPKLTPTVEDITARVMEMADQYHEWLRAITELIVTHLEDTGVIAPGVVDPGDFLDTILEAAASEETP